VFWVLETLTLIPLLGIPESPTKSNHATQIQPNPSGRREPPNPTKRRNPAEENGAATARIESPNPSGAGEGEDSQEKEKVHLRPVDVAAPPRVARSEEAASEVGGGSGSAERSESGRRFVRTRAAE
jgi:hypothetical protein